MTLIIGPTKSGKTHLARIWAANCQAAIPGADQVGDLAVKGGTVPVLLEDVDRAGFEETALFHLLNQSMRDSRPLLMTSREPVANWPFVTDDVKSRARLATCFNILAASDMQLCHMFAKLFEDRQIVVSPNIISYLVARIERSPAEVFALSEILDRLALKKRRPIGRKIAEEAIRIRRGMNAGKGE